jgi:tetratricopeptide (TPR) repeat protein
VLWPALRRTPILARMPTVCIPPQVKPPESAPCSAMLAQALAELSELQFRLGDWAGAYASTVEALRRARSDGSERGSATGLARLALIDAGRGRAEDCRRHAHEAVRLSRRGDGGVVQATACEALGLLELGLGRADAAIERLEWVAHRGEEHPRANASAPAWALDLADAYLMRGDPDGARGALARLVSASGRDELEALFDRALACSARAPLAFERARATLYRGERRHAARRNREGHDRLRASLEAFRALGADPWSRRACEALEAAA